MRKRPHKRHVNRRIDRRRTQKIVKKLTFLVGLAVMLVWKMSVPTAAQNLPETQPTPVEDALPPREPIEMESIPDIQPAPLEIEPGLSEPADGEGDSAQCLPLSTADEMPFDAVDIEVVGNTVLQGEIDQQVACYEGQQITLSDLFNLRSQITQLYIDNDYITSGAFIPNNQLLEGTVRVQVIEGGVEDVQVNGLSRLRDRYVSSRLRGASAPLNQEKLRESLQLLQLDPNIETVNAELTAGSRPGESLLILDLEEPNPFDIFTSTDNLRSPSVGSFGANVSGSYRNLLGIGDVFSATYGLTEGLDIYDLALTFPVNSFDGSLRFGYSNSGSRIVEDTFRDVGIRSDTNTLSLGFRQPIFRSPSQAFALGLDFDRRRSQSFILDDVPFSFSEGPDEGLSRISALRFSQEWTNRGADRVLAARSQFNLGLDIFDATNNASGPDGEFFSWLGQFQWVEQFSPSVLSLFKVNAQLTPDSLLPLERFSLGGVGTVRGYPQNQLVSDNAVNASAELRIPLTKNPNVLQVTPFLEAGAGWNNSGGRLGSNVLVGTGAGLRWQASPNLFLRADYGIPLVGISDRGSSLQDNGFYFSVTYQP